MSDRIGQPPMERVPLASIITTARAGGLDHAWRLFLAAGYHLRHDDPAALAVKGRLLKDQALLVPDKDRAAAYQDAAAAYAAANALGRQPYLMINVATLSWLAGHDEEARALAGELLDWLDSGEPIPETPYYLLATRAEALLLRGETEAARAVMAKALQCDPQGWADHASTIRQLELILAHRGEDTSWLDEMRPPRTLHYAGHLGVNVIGSEALVERVGTIVREEGIGFGFGALAAGADLIVAEALLAAGAELHVILPTDVETFLEQSVTPYAPEWRALFDRCLAAATSVQPISTMRGGYQPLATRLAAEVAMGSAVRLARQLATEAVQMVIVDEGEGPFGSGLETADNAQRWLAAHRRHHVLRWPRNAPVVASGRKAVREGSPDLRLAAMLHIAFDGLDGLDEDDFAETVGMVMKPLRRHSLEIHPQPDLVLPCGNARIAAFARPEAAFDYAQAMFALARNSPHPLRITGHYALAHWLEGPSALVGRALADLMRVAGGAIPGVLTVSETFAAALQIPGGAPKRVEHVGEGAIGALYSVTAG